jgi:hypothetical protein
MAVVVGRSTRSLDCTEMALSEFEQKRCEKIVGAFIESRRPPAHVRPKVDLGFRLDGQSVEIFEIRPRWNNPKEKLEHSVAKATFVKSTGAWRVYWQRADLKWHRYEPAPEVGSLEEFVELVGEDKNACFWG